jgi:hypothetical protein
VDLDPVRLAHETRGDYDLEREIAAFMPADFLAVPVDHRKVADGAEAERHLALTPLWRHVHRADVDAGACGPAQIVELSLPRSRHIRGTGRAVFAPAEFPGAVERKAGTQGWHFGGHRHR